VVVVGRECVGACGGGGGVGFQNKFCDRNDHFIPNYDQQHPPIHRKTAQTLRRRVGAEIGPAAASGRDTVAIAKLARETNNTVALGAVGADANDAIAEAEATAGAVPSAAAG
jgi:hypothetical protein